ncbi:3-methyl-2-oxobutanoate dehydrogenase subunit VorB [Leadbettera azotonutricia]|uniref:2-oxoglutarate oxidoreductase, alpha subunit n=1 Tax=Leadbettera azotonutricia (strain ATCC BAA-888 / DSM 13862 / ZAS-9) TaxID=545695 RepID=F5YBZ1_LEAAZ|nr:3-methyl-2-oxobutanoate dehydrogenase subunit VorB [Leadbettera azotonutricia]AEF82976.1 2-oxoglutarate oxidoreductase, alpha subunit [Leadbettera azotonutricia ZAS-9]
MNSEKVLMKGNDAIAEAAIRAGCTAYFGYPITPQNELIAYMAKNMLDKGRVFIQAESEVAAINMVYGASCAGARAMTSSSSPGISLKQEGISYAAGADVPAVIVNVVRGGPGLGSIAPSQADYFQSTRGGGHGDYYCIVLAPKSVQECADLTYLAFDLADKYRTPVIVLADGMIGQMMEGVVLPPEKNLKDLPKRDWAVGHMAGSGRSDSRHITSIHLVPEELEETVRARYARYETIKKAEVRFEAVGTEDADLVLAAYGTSARICLGARKLAEKEGIKLGIFRPITVWPFPYDELAKIASNGKPLLTVEMSMGQMVEDVKLSVLEAVNKGAKPAPVHLLGHLGGVIPTEEEVFAEAKKILGRK